MTKKYYYEKNEKLLAAPCNIFFEDLLKLDKDGFNKWLLETRDTVRKIWDEDGIPPRVGYNTEDMIAQFNDMSSFPVHEFLLTDEITGTKDVIRNTSVIGNACNQFFPTMLKTKISLSEKGPNYSIYDHFCDDALLHKIQVTGHRNFHRDSFYAYSQCITGKTPDDLFMVPTGFEWVQKFEANREHITDYDYWLQEKSADRQYSGFDDKLRSAKFLAVKADEFKGIVDKLPWWVLTNISEESRKNPPAGEEYVIRFYKKRQRLFPAGIRSFRVGFHQQVVNFPPLTAKFIYERYSEHLVGKQDRIVVYDPSAGWGGRILGAMSVKPDRYIHYVGTDPNIDHWIPELGITKYEYLANFFNENTYRGSSSFFGDPTNTCHIFQLGSEEIHNDPAFQQYKGIVDIAFTSPPYFSKERYSESETQSCVKFGSSYDLWRDGFLKPTIKTAAEWLRPGGYLCWNVADPPYDSGRKPLEQDSIDAAKASGLEYVETLKMVLASMPGGHRVDNETGKPRTKNFCRFRSPGVGLMWSKFEPIYVFRKPL